MDFALSFQKALIQLIKKLDDWMAATIKMAPNLVVAGAPPKVAPNHFRFPLSQLSLYQEIVGILKMLESEFPHRKVVVNIGWPLSSWLDRLSIAVRYINILRLPRRFPGFEFIMRYITKVPIAEKMVWAKREARKRTKKETDKL